ncbi:MAG: type II toxin-antitoxin system YafQ family toxin [Candidatus Babeliaceae bacterium]
MLNAIYENNFKKDIERAKKRGKNMEKLSTILIMLIEEKPLPARYRNHKLQGDYKNYWECHIEPDWLLIYRQTKTDIFFARTGTHSDLF